MTLGLPQFDPLIVSSAGMQVFGFAAATTRLMADSDATGGALSAMRTAIGPGTEAVPPHLHKTAAEFSMSWPASCSCSSPARW